MHGKMEGVAHSAQIMNIHSSLKTAAFVSQQIILSLLLFKISQRLKVQSHDSLL